ncbi:MAG: FkbM family methyltransferase, partial [Sphingobacteriales bacterium]
TLAWENNGWAYNARLASPATRFGHTTQSVPATTMSAIISEKDIEHIDLLKMDVEGAEKQIFSADQSWLQRVDNIIIEIHETAVSENIRNIMLNNGFSFVQVNNSQYSSIYLASRRTEQ